MANKYYLLKQNERLHSVCHNIYLTKHHTETALISQAHAFTEQDMLAVPDSLQDKFVVVEEQKYKAKMQLVTDKAESMYISYNHARK